ncbi:microtubule-associated tumor suppressor candidate 2 [Tamandua tetradactyla]|uniref:microtubule-associated tumor suppressor candidate 2 n=1 Tax=Tamandua tetradactyla TaxID=48850 RepID=UPI0040543899
MSVPMAPKKSCYSQLQDNRNGAKNNNESTLSPGDTNANQIMSEVGSPDEWKTGGLEDEIPNANSSEAAAITHVNKEFHRLQGLGRDSQAGPTSRTDSKLPTTVRGELSTDPLPTPRGTQGPGVSGWRGAPSESDPEVVAPGNAGVTLHAPRGTRAEPPNSEEPRRPPLEIVGSSSLTGQVDLLAGQWVQRASLEPPKAPCPGPGGGERPQLTPMAHLWGPGLPPAEDPSEKTVLRPKPSTSETRGAAPPGGQPVGTPVPRGSEGHPPASAPAAPPLSPPSASEDVPGAPEAQSGLGQQEPQTDPRCAQPRPLQERKAAWAGCPGAQEGVATSSPEGREPCGRAPKSPPHPETSGSVGNSGRGGRGERGVISLSDEDSPPATPQRGPASLGAADCQPPHKISPSADGKLSEMSPSDVSPGDGGASATPTNPTNDGKLLEVSEKRLLGGRNRDSAVFGASDASGGQSKAGVPEPLLHQSRSSGAGENTKMAAAVAENRSLVESAAGTESAPARAEPLRPAPAPLHPEMAVNGAHQPTPSSSRFQNLCVLGVGLESATPSPTHSVQSLDMTREVPDKNACPSGIPKPVFTHSKDIPSLQEGIENGHVEKTEERTETKPLIMPKPKHVRPKIITYIRRNPQALGQVDASLVPVGLPYAPPPCGMPLAKEEKIAGADLKPSASLYEKFKPDLQKPRFFSPGLMVSGIKPPGQHFGQMNDTFLQEVAERPGKEEFCSPTYTHYEVPPTFYRSAMLLKPQLGLGAMSRLPSAKSRILIASQRSSASALHPPAPMAAAASLYSADPSADLKKVSGSNAVKSNLSKSGLRPPGYSRLPAAKLAAFGFVRSSSVSSVSSAQSEGSAQTEPGPAAANRSTFGNEDQPALKTALPAKDPPKGAGRGAATTPPSTATPRRSLLPAPKPTCAPAGTKKEAQKDQDANKPTVLSPKRAAASTTKLHSPGFPKQRAAAPRNGVPLKPDPHVREAERQLVQRLKVRCEAQARQLSLVQGGLRRALCGFEALAVSTQHFFGKSESALVKEKELSVELASVRDEVAFNTAKCEKLQKEKEELERRFEEEVRTLRGQQQAELRALEARLQLQFEAELAHLQEEHRGQLLGIRCQHEEQVEDITASHEAALLEMENHHMAAVAVLQDGHDHRVRELMSAHELEKKELEENFEKLRLSLQDQVDTLTFQGQSLRDRARRFEEALRKSTEEQLEMALAPYQHLEEDMQSLKQVIEMKNQQIHQQEKTIMELEKLVEKNIILEEKIQVLQQQNEDLKARIDQNTVVTRQLSEENANLQEYVEKETQEKKRLSRTNEELLWKLQTGDPTSPVKLSPTSPIYRCSSSGPSSPARVSTAPR